MKPQALITESRIAAIVCDPSLPDNPIVACNDAFVALTGYPRDEVIGRNCRFLQGPRTDPERSAALRDAIAGARPTMVELINYRKNGVAFCNAVMIAPLFDDEGRVRYFLGSQIAVEDDVPDRHEIARHRVATLPRRQREVLASMARGYLNKEIAHELGVSERTIKMHRAALLRALEVRSSAEAIRLAIEAGC